MKSLLPLSRPSVWCQAIIIALQKSYSWFGRKLFGPSVWRQAIIIALQKSYSWFGRKLFGPTIRPEEKVLRKKGVRKNKIFGVIAPPWVGPTGGFVTSLLVSCLWTISQFKELRLSKVSNASSVFLGSTRVSLGSTRDPQGPLRDPQGPLRGPQGPLRDPQELLKRPQGS
jgi:hypothetical protein